MKDELSFPGFTHDSIAGYCNDKPLWAQYRNDKKSKYIGTKELWQELSKTRQALDIANEKLRHCANITVEALDELKGDLLIAYDALLHFSKDPIANNALKQITETKG